MKQAMNNMVSRTTVLMPIGAVPNKGRPNRFSTRGQS